MVTTDASDAAGWCHSGAGLRQWPTASGLCQQKAERCRDEVQRLQAGVTRHSVGTSPMKALLSGAPRRDYPDGPRSASSPPKLGERQLPRLEVDQYPARVQLGDPSYPR